MKQLQKRTKSQTKGLLFTEKPNITMCHPEFISGSKKWILNPVQHDNQRGRSMVEMLGVMMIVGVLSIAGVQGFTYAMNKHRSNELLNGSIGRAVVVAMQLAKGKKLPSKPTTDWISEFTDSTNYDFKVAKNASNAKQFDVEIGNVPREVCVQMQASLSPVIQGMSDCDDTGKVILTFNENLNTDVISNTKNTVDGYTDDDGSDCSGNTKLGEGTSCQVCVQGEYVDSDAKCGNGEICLSGICTPLSDNGCAKNSDCKNQTDSDGENCGVDGCYCNYDAFAIMDACEGPTYKGICVAKSKDYFTEVVVDGRKYVVSRYKSVAFDWWSAKNFCQAYGKRMISKNELGCKEGDNCVPTETLLYSLEMASRSKGLDIESWTTTLTNNCGAMVGGLSLNDDVTFHDIYRDNNNDVFCSD